MGYVADDPGESAKGKCMTHFLDPNEGYIPSRVPREWYERVLERAEAAEARVAELEAWIAERDDATATVSEVKP